MAHPASTVSRRATAGHHGFRSVNGRLLASRPKPSVPRFAMLIVCQNCGTSYQIDPRHPGPEPGGSVRCARCQHVWFTGQSPRRWRRSRKVLPGGSGRVRPTKHGRCSRDAHLRPSLRRRSDDLRPARRRRGQARSPPQPGSPGRPALAGDRPQSTARARRRPTRRRMTLPPPAETGRSRRCAAAGAADLARRRGHRIGRGRRPRAAGQAPAVALADAGAVDRHPGARCDQPGADRLARRGGAMVAADRLALRGAAAAGQSARARVRGRHDRNRDPGGRAGAGDRGHHRERARARVEVPRLRFAVRNASGNEIYTWTALPAKSVLAPGETLAFRSRLASPPRETHDVVGALLQPARPGRRDPYDPAKWAPHFPCSDEERIASVRNHGTHSDRRGRRSNPQPRGARLVARRPRGDHRQRRRRGARRAHARSAARSSFC